MQRRASNHAHGLLNGLNPRATHPRRVDDAQQFVAESRVRAEGCFEIAIGGALIEHHVHHLHHADHAGREIAPLDDFWAAEIVALKQGKAERAALGTHRSIFNAFGEERHVIRLESRNERLQMLAGGAEDVDFDDVRQLEKWFVFFASGKVVEREAKSFIAQRARGRDGFVVARNGFEQLNGNRRRVGEGEVVIEEQFARKVDKRGHAAGELFESDRENPRHDGRTAHFHRVFLPRRGRRFGGAVEQFVSRQFVLEIENRLACDEGFAHGGVVGTEGGAVSCVKRHFRKSIGLGPPAHERGGRRPPYGAFGSSARRPRSARSTMAPASGPATNRNSRLVR